MKEQLIKELEFCLSLWEKRGYCEFGKHTNCKQCASPYLLWKLITGEVIHGENIERLTLENWKDKLKVYNSKVEE